METAIEFIEKYTTKDQDDWLVQKKDIISKFMERYAEKKVNEVLDKAAEELRLEGLELTKDRILKLKINSK